MTLGEVSVRNSDPCRRSLVTNSLLLATLFSFLDKTMAFKAEKYLRLQRNTFTHLYYV